MKNLSKEIYMYVLGALVVIAYFLTIYFLIIKEMPAGNKDLLLIVIGALVAKFGDIIAFFFNSSKSSKDKTDAINELLNKKN